MPEPTINLSLKSGVLLLPLHKYQPDGIAFSAPDQIAMIPEGTPITVVQEAAEPEPALVNTCHDVP